MQFFVKVLVFNVIFKRFEGFRVVEGSRILLVALLNVGRTGVKSKLFRIHHVFDEIFQRAGKNLYRGGGNAEIEKSVS